MHSNLINTHCPHFHRENSQLPLEEQAVSAEPDTRDVPLTGAHDPVFMVLACDGLWDVMLGSEVGVSLCKRKSH